MFFRSSKEFQQYFLDSRNYLFEIPHTHNFVEYWTIKQSY